MKRLIYIMISAIVIAGCSRRTHDAPSSSMEPTIPAGSRVTIDYRAYASASPARFDIVAFRPPHQPDEIFVFRVVGLPGEAIQLTASSVLINGKELFVPDGLEYKPASAEFDQTRLDENSFFLLGDNHANARDSRYFGSVERVSIIGKVIEIEQPNAAYRR